MLKLFILIFTLTVVSANSINKLPNYRNFVDANADITIDDKNSVNIDPLGLNDIFISRNLPILIKNYDNKNYLVNSYRRLPVDHDVISDVNSRNIIKAKFLPVYRSNYPYKFYKDNNRFSDGRYRIDIATIIGGVLNTPKKTSTSGNGLLGKLGIDPKEILEAVQNI